MHLKLQQHVYPAAVLLFCLLIAVIPFFYGATPYHIVESLSWVVIISGILLCAFTFILKKSIALPWFTSSLVFLILMLGWFHVINARGIFDSGFWEILPLNQKFPGLPGTVDYHVSFQSMLRFSSLAVVFFTVLILSHRSRWMNWILVSISLSAAALACLGLIQRAGGAPDIYWGDRTLEAHFFATFRYHGNAGAFLNLTWALIATFFLHALFGAFKIRKTTLAVQLWGGALLVTSISALIHGSRAATLILLLLLPFWIFLNRNRLSFITHLPRKVWGIAGGLLLLILVVLSISVGREAVNRIWALTHEQFSIHQRLQVYEKALPMTQDAGAFGFGPGTFKWMFSEYGADMYPGVRVFWRHLHQDYLQTWIEWGLLGFALWLTFVISCGWRWIHLLRQPRSVFSSLQRMQLRAIGIGLAAIFIHSLVDFPLQIYSIQLITAAFFGILWGIQPSSKKTSHS